MLIDGGLQGTDTIVTGPSHLLSNSPSNKKSIGLRSDDGIHHIAFTGYDPEHRNGTRMIRSDTNGTSSFSLATHLFFWLLTDLSTLKFFSSEKKKRGPPVDFKSLRSLVPLATLVALIFSVRMCRLPILCNFIPKSTLMALDIVLRLTSLFLVRLNMGVFGANRTDRFRPAKNFWVRFLSLLEAWAFLLASPPAFHLLQTL
ncbi:uncharacterized protein LOC131886473 [Tigriopus californicus]|uniref:uncharacterized protein LOC131886473 n=1 Tax=Tigriopus californicus TaxID=6832 RepID=UPI0027DA288D|nr:uncharacterized protein LOC131886473 [Tigriopus californicus]